MNNDDDKIKKFKIIYSDNKKTFLLLNDFKLLK